MSSSRLRGGCSSGGPGLSRAEPPRPLPAGPGPGPVREQALLPAGSPAQACSVPGLQGVELRVSQLIPTLPLTSLKAPACSGLGASWGWGPGPGPSDSAWGHLACPHCPVGLQPRGGGQGPGPGHACLLHPSGERPGEDRSVHVAGRPHSRGFRAAFGSLGEAAEFSHLPGRTEGWSRAGRGEALEGLGPTSCRPDLGQGGGREEAGRGGSQQACREPGPTWELVQDRGVPTRPGQPWPEPAPPGRGTPWGLCGQHQPPWEGPEGAEPALSCGPQRNGLPEGPWASQVAVSPPAPRPGAGLGPAWPWLQGLSWHRAGTAAGARGSPPPPAPGSQRGPRAARPSAWPAPSG